MCLLYATKSQGSGYAFRLLRQLSVRSCHQFNDAANHGKHYYAHTGSFLLRSRGFFQDNQMWYVCQALRAEELWFPLDW